VIAFDAHRGIGVVESDDGVHHDFHCTRIADGSRSVPTGAKVRFEVVAGSLGRWEASEIALIEGGRSRSPI
jgi:cold shock CspA family protein